MPSKRGDAALVALTRTANHSVLWISAAAVLALAGRKRGRRAAVRGLAAVGMASAVSNGPLKFVFRHDRQTRRPLLIRRPSTYSFPSGHSASAFAFATAASAEFPVVAPVLVPLAAAVAYSRVHVGVHRIKDVVAGSAIGVVCGAVAFSVMRGRRGKPRRTPGADGDPPDFVDAHDGGPVPA
jgi:membrane-associated phospholipid phosphatase